MATKLYKLTDEQYRGLHVIYKSDVYLDDYRGFIKMILHRKSREYSEYERNILNKLRRRYNNRNDLLFKRKFGVDRPERNYPNP